MSRTLCWSLWKEARHSGGHGLTVRALLFGGWQDLWDGSCNRLNLDPWQGKSSLTLSTQSSLLVSP